MTKDTDPREDMTEGCPQNDLPEQTGTPTVITVDIHTGKEMVTEDGRVPKY